MQPSQNILHSLSIVVFSRRKDITASQGINFPLPFTEVGLVSRSGSGKRYLPFKMIGSPYPLNKYVKLFLYVSSVFLCRALDIKICFRYIERVQFKNWTRQCRSSQRQYVMNVYLLLSVLISSFIWENSVSHIFNRARKVDRQTYMYFETKNTSPQHNVMRYGNADTCIYCILFQY